MSTKKCSYKGCGSYTSTSHPTTTTFYAFPKHIERLEIWMELGGNLNEKEIPQISRYFCSKHFDESKYVANNPRRKQLLSTAVPFPYIESPQKNDINIVDEYQCVVSSVPQTEEQYDCNEGIELQQDDISEELAHEINCIAESVETFENYEEEYPPEINPEDFDEAQIVESRPPKRKLDQPIIKSKVLQTAQAVPSKRSLKIVTNRPTSTINVYQNQQDEAKKLPQESDSVSIIPESKNVTTFIFKGEEYIQMPKEEYCNEKMAFINKIKSYEEVLKSIKHLVGDVEL